MDAESTNAEAITTTPPVATPSLTFTEQPEAVQEPRLRRTESTPQLPPVFASYPLYVPPPPESSSYEVTS